MVITTPARPSDARGSVAIVLPHLPSICRRSIFNELPASPPTTSTHHAARSVSVLLPSLSQSVDNSVLLTHLHRLAHIVDLVAQPPDREFTASVTSALMKPSPSYNINASRDYEDEHGGGISPPEQTKFWKAPWESTISRISCPCFICEIRRRRGRKQISEEIAAHADNTDLSGSESQTAALRHVNPSPKFSSVQSSYRGKWNSFSPNDLE